MHMLATQGHGRHVHMVAQVYGYMGLSLFWILFHMHGCIRSGQCIGAWVQASVLQKEEVKIQSFVTK